MRIIRLEDIKGNETIAKSIIDMDGRVLLSKGVQIKLHYLNKLKEFGIDQIYIEDKISEGIVINDVLCDETRIKAKKIVQEEAIRFVRNKELDYVKIQGVVNEIFDEILFNKDIINGLKDIRLKDEYTFAHSVNVCVLSILLANKSMLNREKVKSIGTVGLLHDFGKMLISNDILNKPGILTDKEFEEVKNHPINGYNILKSDVTIPSTVKVGVLMHHERVDGAGYPLGLAGDNIHYSAKICGLCDVYDAMTSDRVYKKAIPPSKALDFLSDNADSMFGREYVDNLLKLIPMYPVGTVVKLNNSIIAIVVKLNAVKFNRPQVRCLFNPITREKFSNVIIDLSKDLSVAIENEVMLYEYDLSLYN